MSFDLKLQRVCTHEVLDERASIQGLSPNYFSILAFQSDGSSHFITVREFGATEGLSNYIYARDGFSNWNLSTDGRQINYNTLGLGAGASSFLDGATVITPEPVMLVSYRAHKDQCPMCDHTLGLTKDVEFNLYGQLSKVEGNDKVRQLIFKALLTELGANEVQTDYGSTISLSIGQKYDSFTEFRLHNSIEQAVRFLINEQQTQVGLPLEETILNVSRVSLAQDANDPRIVRVQIEIQTGDFKKVDVTFGMLTQ